MWDGANKKWEKASELEAVSVGSKRIAFTGATPKNVNADKLGEYARKPATFQDNRAVFDCIDVPSRSIWYVLAPPPPTPLPPPLLISKRPLDLRPQVHLSVLVRRPV